MSPSTRQRSILSRLALSLALLAPAGALLSKAAVKAPAKAAAPAATVALSATAASKLSVLGDSTMHKWTVNAGSLAISALLKADGGALESVRHGGLLGLTLNAEVAALKSTESATMDKNLRKAMDADKFGGISFVLASYELKGDEVSAHGTLSIHGQSKPVVLTGKLAQEGGGVAVKGSYDLLMSDYGIKPPVMMLGTVRVADKVTVAYDLALAP